MCGYIIIICYIIYMHKQSIIFFSRVGSLKFNSLKLQNNSVLSVISIKIIFYTCCDMLFSVKFNVQFNSIVCFSHSTSTSWYQISSMHLSWWSFRTRAKTSWSLYVVVSLALGHIALLGCVCVSRWGCFGFLGNWWYTGFDLLTNNKKIITPNQYQTLYVQQIRYYRKLSSI